MSSWYAVVEVEEVLHCCVVEVEGVLHCCVVEEPACSSGVEAVSLRGVLVFRSSEEELVCHLIWEVLVGSSVGEQASLIEVVLACLNGEEEVCLMEVLVSRSTEEELGDSSVVE